MPFRRVHGSAFGVRTSLNGDDVERVGGANDGKEWERNMDIAYVFQDENRLIVSYTVSLW